MSWHGLLKVLLTLAVGGGLTEGIAWLRDLRHNRRDDVAARHRFQRETIVVLQDTLEGWATQLAPYLAGGDASEEILTNIGRIVALTSRLDNQELAAEIRAWVWDVRAAIDAAGKRRPPREQQLALREHRIALTDQLGVELRRWKP